MSEKTLPDYADWLTPDRVRAEDVAWARVKEYVRYAEALATEIARAGAPVQVWELGCGTGWVPWQLQQAHAEAWAAVTEYVGVDRNADCLQRARGRNAGEPRVRWVSAELRDTVPHGADIVGVFAVLKHFRTAEWHRLVTQWFAAARRAVVFTVPLAAKMHDDGTQFTHVWASEADVQAVLAAAGFVEVWRDRHAIEPVIVAVRP